MHFCKIGGMNNETNISAGGESNMQKPVRTCTVSVCARACAQLHDCTKDTEGCVIPTKLDAVCIPLKPRVDSLRSSVFTSSRYKHIVKGD